MKNTLLIFVAILSLFTLAVSCSESDKEAEDYRIHVQWYPNPNGDSELALLMRAMYEEALYLRQQIELGEPFKVTVDHEKMLTAQATEPEKAASPEYKAFANVYIQTMKVFKTAPKEDLPDLYNNLVASCTSCHQAMCPGPLVKIEKLK